ncbi:hypothetical protein ACFL1G_00795, partial [Planctomycetota bacterium]
YENERLRKLGKSKPKTKPNKANLKKAEINVSIYITGAYENKRRFQTIESKPKAKPISTFRAFLARV